MTSPMTPADGRAAALSLRPVLAELGFRFAQGFSLQAPVGSAEAAGVAARVL